MHDTAMEYGKQFFDTYAANGEGLTIVDLGAQDINGSLRSVAPQNAAYIGLDFAEGNGVDMVITDPYALPLESNSVDICVSSSCFEHSEFFWLSFNEVLRVLKPQGLFYLNVPSNGAFHRYPVDCWRFYPDSGIALENWGRRSGFPVVLLESFTGIQKMDVWNDFVAVFLKNRDYIDQYPTRILHSAPDLLNGLLHGSETFINLQSPSQDQNALMKLKQVIQSYGVVLTDGV